MQHSTTPLPTVLFSTEVIEEVIDQASDDPRTLRRLALLCKSLLTRARIHLFASIVIRSVQQMESSSEFLDSRPWVLPLVQKVILSANIPWQNDFRRRPIPLLDIIRVHLFTRLPNLRVWEMSCHWTGFPPQSWLSLHRSTLLCYQIYGSRIQNLKLASIRMQGVSHFIRLVSAFTSLQSLICSSIVLPYPTEDQTSLHASDISSFTNPLLKSHYKLSPFVYNRLANLPMEFNPNFKIVSKPPTIRHLSVSTSVDIRLVEYLLGSSQAMLASLSLSLCHVHGQMETYLGRLEVSLSRLSELSSLTLVISCTTDWSEHDGLGSSPVERIRWATRVLNHVRKSSPLRAVQVQFDMKMIAHLRGTLYDGLSPELEACSELEESLLNFPSCNLRFCWLVPNRRRAGRPEFWSLTIRSAFPKLNERGLLALPYTCPLLDPFGHEDRVACLVALKDNKRIATASNDGTIIVWDTELGIIEQQWLAHRSAVCALDVSPNNQHVVSAGSQFGESPVVWDISDGVSKIAVLASIDQEKRHGMTFAACTWSPDGTLIASARGDGTIRIWDALTFQQHAVLRVPNANFDWSKPTSGFQLWLQWSADSQYLAFPTDHDGPQHSLAGSRQWAIWSPLAEKSPKKFPSLPARSPSTNFSTSGISGLQFDTKSKYAVATINYYDSNRLVVNGWLTEDALVEEDGSSHGSHSGYICIWDVVDGAMVADLEHPGVVGVHFSPDGRSLLSLSGDGSVKIWDMDNWHETASLKIDLREMTLIRFSPSGLEYVATVYESANDDCTRTFTPQLWRLGETSQCVAVFMEHKERVTHLKFSPDGRFLASGDRSGIVHIHCLSRFLGH